MPTLTIYRGISGSGKTTHATLMAANNPNIRVVNRDTLRTAIYGKPVLTGKEEKRLAPIQSSIIASHLRAGNDVIVDNTSVRWEHVLEIADIGHMCDATVTVKNFTVDLDEAIRRVTARASMGGLAAPTRVIREQHKMLTATLNYVLPRRPERYERTLDAPEAVIFDIDGTITRAHESPKPVFDGGEKEKAWAAACVPDEDMIRQMSTHQYVGDIVIIMTSRGEVIRNETTEWLKKHGAAYDLLLMRETGDRRPAAVVKTAMFNSIRDSYRIIGAYEDNPAVVQRWRTMNVRCFDLGSTIDL